MLISKESRIFIAGHNGMVGSAIKRSLTKKGYKNLLFASRNDLDLLDFVKVKDWFNKNRPEIVILAAAKVGGIHANSKYMGDFILENLKIQNNVIENAWKYKVKRFLFLGSSCIYPKFAQQPLKEEYLLTGELEKTNESYALAKISGIKLCTSLKEQYGFDSICLMPTNLYGPGDNYHPQNSHVLPAMLKRFYDAKIKGSQEIVCWGSGLPKREFLYVDDLAEASIFILENISSEHRILYDDKKNFNGILNVGLGKDISIKELANLISSAVGYEGKIKWDLSKPDGTPRKLLDVSKLSELGWSAKTELQKGLELTLKSFLAESKNKSIRY
ncbi:GDP-L-fucose synthase [Prochlorococcus sp. MIT 1314]|uniref:GDP-L-fucose synthase family protein n=1 Tax=Prochlorococcus sp. MIT 1314 TaxID=3096220 RepID=UPI002A764859|nr:GDP-L-fucose synthase [Prochlorococcus sp. MIT 1314]